MRSIVSFIALSCMATAASAEPSGPTCSDQFGISNHGQHIVGDYVSGLGGFLFGDDLGWPPNGQDVGEAVHDNGGAYLPGGPGPAFHFDHGAAPGASFCTDSQSPGDHY